MKNTTLLFTVIFIFLLTILAGIVIRDKFMDSEKKVVSKTSFLFKQAIPQEYNRRSKNSEFHYSLAITQDWPQEKIVFTTEKGERVQTDIEAIRNLSMEEKLKLVGETLLQISSPIDPDSLNTFFREILQQRNISVLSGVRYTETGYSENDNGYTLYSSGTDTAFFASAYPLPEYTTGIFDEITVQAYVKVPFSTVVKKAGAYLTIPFFGWLLIVSAYLIYIMYRRQAKKREEAEIKAKAEIEAKLARTEAKLTDIIGVKDIVWMDEAKTCLHYKDQKVELTTLLAQVVSLCLDKPDNFVTIEEIAIELWGKPDLPRGRITQLMSRLRTTLADIPELRVESTRGVGYRLVLNTCRLPDGILKSSEE